MDRRGLSRNHGTTPGIRQRALRRAPQRACVRLRPVGIPATARPSMATLLRLGEEMDADYLIVGRYSYDGQTFTATAQLLDMKALRLSPEVKETGQLPKLLELQLGLTWDLMRQMDPNQLASRNAFAAAGPSVRL